MTIDVKCEEVVFDVSKIGYSFPPFQVHVELVKIRELALAIGDTNPIYQSVEAAQIELVTLQLRYTDQQCRTVLIGTTRLASQK